MRQRREKTSKRENKYMDRQEQNIRYTIKDIRRTLGWRVECKFQLGLHKRDLPFLLEILKYFSGIGSIYSSTTSNLVNYSIHSNKQLLTLINDFNKYPLITQAPKGVEQIIYYLKK